MNVSKMASFWSLVNTNSKHHKYLNGIVKIYKPGIYCLPCRCQDPSSPSSTCGALAGSSDFSVPKHTQLLIHLFLGETCRGMGMEISNSCTKLRTST